MLGSGAQYSWSSVVALVLLELIIGDCQALSILRSATPRSATPGSYPSAVMTPSAVPVVARKPTSTMGIPPITLQSASKGGAMTPTTMPPAVTPAASPGTVVTPAASAPWEVSMTLLTLDYLAAVPPSARVPRHVTNVAVRVNRCMRLTIAPGDSDVFSPLALVARLPAGAAPFATFSWTMLSPSGAGLVLRRVVSKVSGTS